MLDFLLLTLLVGAAEAAFGPATVRAPSQPVQLWERELAAATRYLPDSDRLVAYQALKLAHRVHEGQTRADGQPFVTHPVAVARLVASWGMDVDSVCAALLHDSVEDTPLTFTEVEESFGNEVRSLVQGVTRVSKIDPAKLAEFDDLEAGLPDAASASTRSGSPALQLQSVMTSEEEEQQQQQQPIGSSDDVLRLLHSCAGDWRVAILKIADRLHNMRTMGPMLPRKRAKKALETERVFVPLAHYLGAHDVATELARLSHRYHADDQPHPQRLAARLGSVIMAPRQRLSPTLEWARGLRGRIGSGDSTFDTLQFSRPAAQPRSPGSERRMRRLILQLDEAEPARAQSLYTQLRPLHERLTRHQAVMMRERERGDAWQSAHTSIGPLRLPRSPTMAEADADHDERRLFPDLYL